MGLPFIWKCFSASKNTDFKLNDPCSKTAFRIRKYFNVCLSHEPCSELVNLALSYLLKETDPRVSQQGLFANFPIPLNIFPEALLGKLKVEAVSTYISKPINAGATNRKLNLPSSHSFVDLFQAWDTLSSTQRESITINWGNGFNFKKMGFGIASFAGESLTGYIYSSARSENKIEASLFVDEKFRGQGIGLILAEEFVKLCHLKGITVCWTCMSNNIPSNRIAKAIGLAMVSEEEFYYWRYSLQSPLREEK